MPAKGSRGIKRLQGSHDDSDSKHSQPATVRLQCRTFFCGLCWELRQRRHLNCGKPAGMAPGCTRPVRRCDLQGTGTGWCGGTQGVRVVSATAETAIELLRTALSPPWAPLPSALLVGPCRQFGQRVVPGSLAVLMACEGSEGKTVACGVGCEASLVPAASSLRRTFLAPVAPCSLLAVLRAGSRVGPVVCRLGGMSVITQ